MEKDGGSSCPTAAGLALWRGWLCSSHRDGQPGQPLSGACFLASKGICNSDRFGRRPTSPGETVPRRKSFVVQLGWRCRFVVCAMDHQSSGRAHSDRCSAHRGDRYRRRGAWFHVRDLAPRWSALWVDASAYFLAERCERLTEFGSAWFNREHRRSSLARVAGDFSSGPGGGSIDGSGPGDPEVLAFE